MSDTVSKYFEDKAFNAMRDWLSYKHAPYRVCVTKITLGAISKRKDSGVFDGLMRDGIEWICELNDGSSGAGWYGFKNDDFRVEQRPDA